MRRNQNNDTILIIDDNPINIRSIFQTLARHGFEAIIARNGLMGIRLAKFSIPDLILLDIMMPGINGFETCHQLKADNKTKHIPVIFMTGLTNVLYKVKGFEVGGVDYLIKPVEEAELLARLQTHLKVHQLQKELETRNQELQMLNKKLERLVQIDGLTQIANRRHFDTYLMKEWRRLKRNQAHLSLILIDIDCFKQYNDYYGHLAGDDCLKTIAKLLQQTIRRPADLAARYGGEEFALILPDTPQQGAIHVAQQVQHQLAQLQKPHAHSMVSNYVTCSMGVATIIPSDQASVVELVHQADQALYQAKSEGRDRIGQNT